MSVILASQNSLLGRIKLAFGADWTAFEHELMPLVRGYAGFVHLLPATADNYFRSPGGLLQLGLETAFFSLQGTDAHIVSGRATISERRELEPRWRIATFIGGLCCELHRAMSHLIVTTAAGEEWSPYLGRLTDWLAQRRAERYFVRWRPNARESRGLGLFALPHVIPGEILHALGQGNSFVLPQLMASIGGVPQYREHNVLDDLVRRSMALVIDRNLLANADRYGTPQYGSHLERYLVDALRRLAAGHSAWIPNRDKSRVWFGPDGLFLVWPGAAEDVLSQLASDHLAGVPRSSHTLLELLLDAGVFVARGPNQPTWSIQPPGAKLPIEGVKLSTSALLLAGLDPMPQPLAAPLVANARPSAATPTPDREVSSPDTPPAEPAAASQPAMLSVPQTAAPADPQLSLLDGLADVEPTEPPEVLPPHQSDRPVRAIRLTAPMRLNPAVRDALAEIITTLNDGARTSDVCTVADGVFMPLSEFEVRGIQPGIAIRALLDARMLRRPDSDGPATVSRDIRGTATLGVVLAAAHVNGLDPSVFTTSDTGSCDGLDGTSGPTRKREA